MGFSSALRARRSSPAPRASKSSATRTEKTKSHPQELLMPVRAKGLLALFVFGALTVSARAADTPPPAAPAAPAATAPAAPSPAAITAADKILNTIGLKQSIAIVVPGMMQELETNVTRTRPESMLASLMSEQEITEVAAFFESPAGKKYRDITPTFIQNISDVTGAWREKLSTDILERARAEMKKKGVDF